MLVLSRKEGERIQIGSTIEVTVLRTCSRRVRLGFSAPPGIPIHRQEVQRRLEAGPDQLKLEQQAPEEVHA